MSATPGQHRRGHCGRDTHAWSQRRQGQQAPARHSGGACGCGVDDLAPLHKDTPGQRAAACRALLEHGRAQICQRCILAGHAIVRANGT